MKTEKFKIAYNMKKLTILSAAFFCAVGAIAQPAQPVPVKDAPKEAGVKVAAAPAQPVLAVNPADVKVVKEEVLALRETSFDFGKIPQGKPVYHEFIVQNIGKVPLKLDNISTTCGCTTPEWSRDEIAPGATTKIKVGYNAYSEGSFEKWITITYNGSQNQQMKISGNVWKAPAASAPENGGTAMFKNQN